MPKFPAPSHWAAVAEDFAHKLEAVVRFLQSGVERGDDCVLVIPESDRSRWEQALAERGVVPDPSAGVQLMAAREWVPPRGLNSLRMTRRLWDRIENALLSFREFRIAIDMAWTLESAVDAAQVCHWEATCDHLLGSEAHAHMLCVYNPDELPVPQVHAGLRTHGHIDCGTGLAANPFFEAPAILEHEPALNSCSGDAAIVNGMLGHFRRAA